MNRSNLTAVRIQKLKCNAVIANFINLNYAEIIYNIRLQRSGKDNRFILSSAGNA